MCPSVVTSSGTRLCKLFLARDDDDETPSEKVSANSRAVTTMFRCVQGHSQSQGSPSSVTRHRRSFPVGRRTSARKVKGKAKTRLSMLTCPGSIVSVSHRMFCSKKKSSADLPYFFAWLKLLPVTRTLVTSRALRKGRRDSHRNSPSPFGPTIF